MKRIFIILFLSCLVLLLTGCQEETRQDEGDVAFYYIRDEFEYEANKTIIDCEYRDVDGELQTIIDVYLQGPISSSLHTPFPEHTQLLKVSQKNGCLEVLLSKEFAELSGIDLTLACGAMAKTCLSLTQVDEICIQADNALLNGTSSITMTADSLLLTDNQ